MENLIVFLIFDTNPGDVFGFDGIDHWFGLHVDHHEYIVKSLVKLINAKNNYALAA